MRPLCGLHDAGAYRDGYFEPRGAAGGSEADVDQSAETLPSIIELRDAMRTSSPR